MHIADFTIGMLGANGIVGGGIGIATGAALSSSIRKSGQVTLCFFGEGAINQGILLECGNMAAIWNLPLVLVCENNQFSMSTRPNDVTSIQDLSKRAEGLGISGAVLDGMDVLAVYETVSAAVAKARSGQGPAFVEARCFRFEGHFLGDGLKYRDAEELAVWRERDPVMNWRKRLLDAGVLSQQEADRISREVESEVLAAIEFAKASPFPDPGTAWDDVYAQ